jgi:hypothetical protein
VSCTSISGVEALHPHQFGMTGDGFGDYDEAFGEAGVPGDVLREA